MRKKIPSRLLKIVSYEIIAYNVVSEYNQEKKMQFLPIRIKSDL